MPSIERGKTFQRILWMKLKTLKYACRGPSLTTQLVLPTDFNFSIRAAEGIVRRNIWIINNCRPVLRAG